jgi:hypothetical protein
MASQTPLVEKALEYAEGQILIPTVIELDEMRLLLRLLVGEVTRLRVLTVHLDHCEDCRKCADAGES